MYLRPPIRGAPLSVRKQEVRCEVHAGGCPYCLEIFLYVHLITSRPGTYYWNTLTNETTMVGEAKPLTMYRQPVQQPEPQGSVGGMVMQSMAMGVGVALAFGLVSWNRSKRF